MYSMIKKNQSDSGFSFAELMVVLAIVSIMSAVAIPAYFNHIMRIRQKDAISELMIVKAALEKYFVENETYTTSIGLLPEYASAGTAPGAQFNATYYRYQISAAGTIQAQGDINGDGLYCDGWQVASTNILAKPEQYSLGCNEGIGFSILDNF